MKTVLDFLGQLWLRFLKPNGPITIPHQTEGKAKRFSDNNSLLQKSLETFLQEIIEFRFNLLSDETEYRYKRSEADRFYPVTQRDLNSICMEAAGVTEELKACDPMRGVGLMNTVTAQIEEILIRELICS